MGVSTSSEYLKLSIFQLDDAHVKCSCTEGEDENILFYVITKLVTVGDGSGGRLIDDGLDSEACDVSCIDGRLSLQLVEACRHCDYCGFTRTIISKIFVGNAFQLTEDHRRDFFGIDL